MMTEKGYARPKTTCVAIFGDSFNRCSFTLFSQQKWEYKIKSDMVTLRNEKKHILFHVQMDWFENNFEEVKMKMERMNKNNVNT